MWGAEKPNLRRGYEEGNVSPRDQPVTFVELFFDLVFVFAVTQLVVLAGVPPVVSLAVAFAGLAAVGLLERNRPGSPAQPGRASGPVASVPLVSGEVFSVPGGGTGRPSEGRRLAGGAARPPASSAPASPSRQRQRLSAAL